MGLFVSDDFIRDAEAEDCIALSYESHPYKGQNSSLYHNVRHSNIHFSHLALLILNGLVPSKYSPVFHSVINTT